MSQEDVRREPEAAAGRPDEEPPAASAEARAGGDGRPASAPPAALTRAGRSPRSSIWPPALALAIAVLCAGLVTHPVVLVIGALLVVAAAAGWALERR